MWRTIKVTFKTHYIGFLKGHCPAFCHSVCKQLIFLRELLFAKVVQSSSTNLPFFATHSPEVDVFIYERCEYNVSITYKWVKVF